MANAYPQIVYEADHNWGQDFSLNAQKDLANSSGLIRSQQRVLRRLMTIPGNYPWQPTYGAGLPRFVGQDLSSDRFAEIKSLINSQIFLEESVARNPPPVISLQIFRAACLYRLTILKRYLTYRLF